jgi:DNA-directed RNA polymerase specialized sigma24 family protein
MSADQARTDDSRAAQLRQTLDRYYARVLGFAYQVLGDAELAARAAEDVFARSPLPEDEIAVWRAAMTTIRGYLRRGFVVRPLVTLSAGWQADLLHGMADLDPEERALLLLRYHEGLTVEAIAAVLDQGMDESRRRIAEARNRLIDRIEESS